MIEVSKGDLVYYARIFQDLDIYEVCELRIRTVTDSYFVGIEQSTKHAFIFGNENLGKIVFFKREDALEMVLNAEKNRIPVNNETYYEEY